MRRLRPMIAALRQSREGAALVEFAIIAPTLLMLYLMAFTLADAVSCNRKVAVTTRELTDVLSRFSTVEVSDVGNVMNAATQIMSPYASDTNRATVRLSQVQVTDATHAKVLWTCISTGSNSLAKDTVVSLPANMVSTIMTPDANATPARAGAFFIMGEVIYNYQPAFSYRGFGALTFQDRIFLVPRSPSNISLINTSNASSPTCSL